MKKDQRFVMQFDVEMLAWLKSEADRRRCSVAQVVRDLVLAAMEQK
ncbi:MAG: hypothetical protein WC683_00970 [bacterium]